MNPAELAKGVLAGERRSISRGITWVEAQRPAAGELMAWVYPKSGRAHSIGITGSPGAGKSTLVDRLIGRIRSASESVAVVAVDPSSPFSGGAILGDRVRMTRHHADSGVFIRSMASRGSLGGLATATREVVHLLDGAGFDRVLVETVGVGQAEVSVASTTMTTVVVLVPDQGDSVQALKAGIMETADVFVINKADRDGAARLEAEVRAMLELAAERPAWLPPIVCTVSTSGEGIDELMEAVEAHRSWLVASGHMAYFRRRAARSEVEDALGGRLARRALEALDRREDWLDQLAERRTNLARVLEAAADSLFLGEGGPPV